MPLDRRCGGAACYVASFLRFCSAPGNHLVEAEVAVSARRDSLVDKEGEAEAEVEAEVEAEAECCSRYGVFKS